MCFYIYELNRFHESKRHLYEKRRHKIEDFIWICSFLTLPKLYHYLLVSLCLSFPKIPLWVFQYYSPAGTSVCDTVWVSTRTFDLHTTFKDQVWALGPTLQWMAIYPRAHGEPKLDLMVWGFLFIGRKVNGACLGGIGKEGWRNAIHCVCIKKVSLNFKTHRILKTQLF